MIRVGGKRYPVNLVRVTDPNMVVDLKKEMEVLAAGYLGATTLPPPPAEPPNDIWFFRVAPLEIAENGRCIVSS